MTDRPVYATIDGPITLCGYSFGAVAATHFCDETPMPKRLVLIAPPSSMLDKALLAAFPGKIFMAAGDNDEYLDLEVLAELAATARAAHLEVIRDCDHFFMSGLPAFRAALDSWWSDEG